MEHVPVGKRTRFQKALKKKDVLYNSRNYLSDDDEACFFIDKSDFLETTNSKNSENNSAKKFEGFERDFGCNSSTVYGNGDHPNKGFEDKGKRVIDDGAHDDDDDDDDDEDDDGNDANNGVNANNGVDVVLEDDDDVVRVYDDYENNDVCVYDDDGGDDVVRVYSDDDGDDVLRVYNDDDDDDDNVVRVYNDDDDDVVRVYDGDDEDYVVQVNDDKDVVCDDDEEKGRQGTSNVGFKRGFEGEVLRTNLENNVEEKNFIGKRTRSHYKPMYLKKKTKHGTFSNPITIDVDDYYSSDDKEDSELKSHKDGGGKRKRGRPPLKKDDNEELELDLTESRLPSSHDDEEFRLKTHVRSRQEEGGKRKRGGPPSKKADKVELELKRTARVKRLKSSDVQNALLNAILENRSQVGLDNCVSSVSEAHLPLKFRFGVQHSVPEKSEEEQERECLLKEMDVALGVCNIGLNTSSLEDDEDENVVPCDSAILNEKLCLEGKHHWVHDDEIGIRCQFCSFVKLEIRNVMPDFNKYPFGRPKENRYYGPFSYNDLNVYDGFQFPDLSYDSRGNSSPSDDHISGTVWGLIPGIKRDLFPHQRDGFEFIWRKIAGGIRLDELAKPTKSGGGGCIICHAPGTGKTRLAIVFLQSFMKQYPDARPVILAPCSMLRTWEEEFARWKVDIPFFNLNEKKLSGKEDLQQLEQKIKFKDEHTIRLAKLSTWSKGKGVLAMSYELFQTLAAKKFRKVSVSKKFGEGSLQKKIREASLRQVFLERPGILVLDEGHKPRNKDSCIYKVLKEVVTKKVVILSGTPFQNNFEELASTFALVQEEFEVPPCQMNDDRRIKKLRKQIKPFVHVHKGEILRETLPGLFHSVVYLRPSDLQKMFFALLATLRRSFLEVDNLISNTSVHPSIFCEKETVFPFNKEHQDLLEKNKLNIYDGVKTWFLVELIKLCRGERVLVFGQCLPALEFIGDLLKFEFRWTKGREFLYIDGHLNMKDRQSLIKLFNDPKSESRVLLASTKACCEGISLVGASRVVLLDVVWNPAVERQAISRAYRLGQQKDVFVYHLITWGTLEEKKICRQADKEHCSELLFSSFSSSKEEIMHKKSIGSSVLTEDHILEAMTHHEKTKHMFEKIIFQPKADELIESFGL